LRSVGIKNEDEKPLTDAQKKYFNKKAASVTERVKKMKGVKKGKL